MSQILAANPPATATSPPDGAASSPADKRAAFGQWACSRPSCKPVPAPARGGARTALLHCPVSATGRRRVPPTRANPPRTEPSEPLRCPARSLRGSLGGRTRGFSFLGALFDPIQDRSSLLQGRVVPHPISWTPSQDAEMIIRALASCGHAALWGYRGSGPPSSSRGGEPLWPPFLRATILSMITPPAPGPQRAPAPACDARGAR
jgi:hypothetical protein